MKKLSSKEIKKFSKKYFSNENIEFQEVNLLKYYFVKEYLADKKILVIDKFFKIKIIKLS